MGESLGSESVDAGEAGAEPAPSVPVIDAHTHLFPPELVTDRSTHLNRDTWFAELFSSPNILMVTVEAMLESMDSAGIQHSVVCGWPWKDPVLCREHNDFLAEACRRYPDRLSWLAIVNPSVRGADAEIVRCVAEGAVGAGELNADAQNFTWDEPSRLMPMVDACVSLGVPMLMHCSEPVGHRYPGKGTATPERILVFLEAAPELSVIAAHWGGGLPFYELMPEVARLTRNVVYDSAASTYLYGFDVFPIVERLAGDDRILFASDYPVLRPRPFLRKVRESGITRRGAPGILSGNAERVFGLSGRGNGR